MFLSKLKKEGVITAPSRGIYELDSHTPFQPNISITLKRIFNKIKREFYKSAVDGHEEPLLLDLLYTPNPYPEIKEYPINYSWLATSGKDTTMVLPTFEAILGDKMTAFAPKTTGILYSQNRPVKIVH